MVEIVSEVVAGFLGAIAALFLREVFAWKGQGRNEALKRNEKLIMECFGKLKFLIDKTDTEELLFLLDYNDYFALVELSRRFSFRFPKGINEKIDDIIHTSALSDNRRKFIYECEEDAAGFKASLGLGIDFHIDDLVGRIQRLESYYESIFHRLWFIFFVWNF